MLKNLVVKILIVVAKVIKHVLFVVIYGVLCLIALFIAETVTNWLSAR